ncbi:ABC transporter substrate-binding protein [Dactylosporangium sp. CA-092794]|uniref:ABC transporter substrate-binding protein n=1 Tax=Dactylosporangium sp. CA-092794 TaxID=3239929 RepID=UPI003D8F5F46
MSALAVAASACSSSSSPTNSDNTPGKGGVAKVAYEFSEVQGVLLDAVASKGGYHPWLQLMYDSMIRQGPKGELIPGLATKWAFPDAKTIDLTLRQGVKFQDGTPFNAAAVKFSWDRIIASKTMAKSSQIAAMTSVDAPSDYEVVVHLSGPYATDWRDRFLISSLQLAVASPTAVQKAGSGFSSAPIGGGAGPYEFVSYTPSQKLVLKANPNYWNPSAVTLDEIDFINTASGAPTIAALKGGVANIAFTSGGAAISSAKSSGLNVSATLKPDWATSAYFCASKPPFNNVDARKAVLYALNRAEFVSGPFGGYAIENPTTVPSDVANYPGDAVPNPYPYDLSKAKAALASAGVAPGTTITVIADPTQVNSAVLQVMQAQLDTIGLKLSILPTANAFADLKTKVPNIYYSGTGLSYGSQSIFVAPGGSTNYCNFNNADLNAALLKTQDPNLTPEQQKAAWADYQRVYYQVVPGFNIADIKQATISTKDVSGIPADHVQSQGDPEAWAGIWVKS